MFLRRDLYAFVQKVFETDRGQRVGIEPDPILTERTDLRPPHHGKIEGDKVMRLSAQAAHFHVGVVHFPEGAPWLDELITELLGFPAVRHDDQVDSISQALAFISWSESHRSSWQPLPF